MRSFLSLGNAGDLVTESINLSNAAWAENTALSAEAAQRYNTTASMFATVKNVAMDMVSSVGGALLPFLRDAMEAARPFVQEFAQKLPDLMQSKVIPAIRNVVSGIQDLIAKVVPFVQEHGPAIKNVLIAIGAVLAGAAIAAAIASIAGAIAALANPVTLIIAAIALLAAAWTEDWGGIRTTLTDVWDNSLKPIFDVLVEWLQTNIPVAIATLSQFWEETLLPAIQKVWAFIDAHVIPLIKALVEVWLASLKLWLAVIAEVWEHILLPAITAVWSFIKEKAIPVIETVVGWFKDWGKEGGILGKALDGVRGAVEKATEWFGKLADKIKAAGDANKGTDIEPGSPTPLEIGFRGITDSLGPLIIAMREFASSVTESQAKALKNMAKAMKELATGIVRLAEASQMGGPLGGGGMASIEAQLMDFERFALVSMARIEVIVDAIGYNRIKKLRLTARRLREIIESVIIDLSGIALYELPDMKAWGDQFVAVAFAVESAIHEVRAELGMGTLEKSAEAGSLIRSIIGIIKPAIDAMVDLAEYEPVGSLADKMTNFGERINEVITELGNTASLFDVAGIQSAALFYAASQQIVEFIAPAINAFVALFNWDDPGSLKDKVTAFGDRVIEALAELETLPERANLTFEEGYETFWQGVGTMLGFIDTGVKALEKLAAYEAVNNLPAQIKSFVTQIKTTVVELANLPATIAGAIAWGRTENLADVAEAAENPLESIEGMAAFFEGLEPIFATVKKAAESIKQIFELQDALELDDGSKITIDATMKFFRTAMRKMMNTLGKVAADLEGGGLTAAQRFYNVAVTLADTVRAGMNAIATMAEEGIAGTPVMLNEWVTAINAMLAMLSGGGMTIATAGGGGLPAQPMAGAGGPQRQQIYLTQSINITLPDGSVVTHEEVVELVDEALGDLEV